MEQVALSVAEACRLAGVGRTYFYRLLKQGAFPARRLGKRTLILKSDLERWLSSLPTIG